MRWIVWAVFTIAVTASLFCGYAYAYWAWVTATPLTPAQLARAQYNAHVWLTLAGLCVAVAGGALIIALRHGRRGDTRGFQVIVTSDDSRAR
jgi:hypothetical protein